ncbi:hypothetical protein AGLY_017051 [Aphis glycines]|uniref:Uncharacterized protein n=1 Tax=Aphis glycines TaxID=307491 RepID=A0A6G0SWB4_APHGL|nr:hypothetical protein AGLY_017051 [Aphis glycines]
MTEKRQFLRKTGFRPNRFFFMVWYLYIVKFLKNFDFFDVDKKFLDDQKVLKIYYKVPYEFSNFYEICRKRENLQNTSAQFFLLAFEVQILTKIRQNHEYLQIICSSKFIKLFVFISNVKKFNTKFSISFVSKIYRENFKRHYRKNVLSNIWQYLIIIYSKLSNDLRSESFFVYNDTYHCIQI